MILFQVIGIAVVLVLCMLGIVFLIDLITGKTTKTKE